jgi:TrmH family RNA methyltransferase
MRPVRITSRHHPVIRKIQRVAARVRGAPADLVLAEGTKVLDEALSSPFGHEVVLVRDGYGSLGPEGRLLAEWARRGVPVYQTPEQQLLSLSDVLAPQGALALVHVPRNTLDRLALPPEPLVLCTCGIQDPGNLGTLLRTARATGVAAVITTSGTASVRNPKVIRSSAGAFFHLPVIERVDSHRLAGYLAHKGIRVFLARAAKGEPCWNVDLRGPSALVLGNESRGVQGAEWEGFSTVHIPMTPEAESLNVAAAGAILMYEAMKQRSARHSHGRESRNGRDPLSRS